MPHQNPEYELTDAAGNQAVATVTITVTPLNDPPVAADDNGGSLDEGDSMSMDLAANDSDAENGLLLDSIAIRSLGPICSRLRNCAIRLQISLN